MIAVVDANFPAASTAVDTTYEESVVLAGADLPQTLSAITSLLPIDLFIDDPVGVMVSAQPGGSGTSTVGSPRARPPGLR